MQPACPSAHQGDEYQALQAAYVEYAAGLLEGATESGKQRISRLSEQLQARGVHGSNALQLLQRHAAQIDWQGMGPEMFSSFYRFVYFLCREPGKRNVQVSTAVAAWRLVLCGRFRLLDSWCSYVSAHHKSSVVLEDTWRQVLDFSRTVHEDLGNYDPASAWPVLLDEFVEHLVGRRYGGRAAPAPPVCVPTGPLGLLALGPWAVRPVPAMSPRSGSKRRLPDILEVADQLQQLPLDSGGAPRPWPASPDAAAAQPCSSPTGGAQPRALLLSKRTRLAAHAERNNGSGGAPGEGHAGDGMQFGSQEQQHEGPTAPQGEAAAGSGAWPFAGVPAGGWPPPRAAAHAGAGPVPPAAQQLGRGGDSDPATGCMRAPGPPLANARLAGALQPAGPSSAAAATTSSVGGNGGSMAAPAGNPGGKLQQQRRRQQQQQQQQPGGLQAQQPHLAGLGLQLQPHRQPPPRHLQAAAAAAAAAAAGRGDSESMRRTSSVTAMMRVTVTEALGFN